MKSRKTGLAVLTVVVLAVSAVSMGMVVAQQDVQQENETNDKRENAVNLTLEPTSVEGISTVTISGFNSSDSNNIARFGPGDHDDWYSFKVEAGQAIRAWGHGGMTANLNAVLVGPNGEVLSNIGLGAENYPFGVVAEETGTYYIHIHNETETGGPVSYSLTIQTAEPGQYEPNDNRNGAEPIKPGNRLTPILANSSEDDWYAVHVGEGGVINATLRTLTYEAGGPMVSNGLSVTIFTPNGTQIGEVADLGHRYADINTTYSYIGEDTVVIVAKPDEAGIYYVRVTGTSVVSASIGFSPYSLTISGEKLSTPTTTTPPQQPATTTHEPVGISTPTKTASALPNTLSIRSTGDDRVYYNVTVSEQINPGAGADLTGAEHPDDVSNTMASGSTAQGGIDNFTFSGEITVLKLAGGPAKVYINGEQVDPAAYQTATPTSTPTPTPTPTLTPTTTSTPTPTPAPTSPTAISMTPSTKMQTTISAETQTQTLTEHRTSITNTPVDTQAGQLGPTTTDTPTDDQTGMFGPGFGVIGAVLAAITTVIIGLVNVFRRL